MSYSRYHKDILFWLAVAGLILYAVGPIFFPTVKGIRQPELLPIYAAMFGVGQLLKSGGKDEKSSGQTKNGDK